MMKTTLKRMLSLLLCTVMLTGMLPMGAMAAGVTVTATPSESTLLSSATDKTVTLSLKLDAPLDIYAVDWKVASAPSNQAALTFSDGAWSDAATYDFYNNIYSGSRSADNVNTDTIGTVTVTVPANAPAGTYTIDVSGISIADMSGTYLLEDATATATITVVDDETVGFDAVVSTEKDDYNAGETFDATITLTRAEAANIRGYQFELGYDSSKLTLGTINMGSDFTEDQTATNGNKIAGTTSGDGVEIGADGKVLAKVSFTVNEDVTDLAKDTITLNNVICSKVLNGKELVSNVTGKEVTLHNIIVTLNADANSTVDSGASKTLYAKYNETGLYSDKARSTAVTSVAAAANEGYKLKENANWTDGTTEYADYAAIAALTFTEAKTFTLQTIAQYTITIVTAENATTTDSTDPITVDNGTKLSEAGLPTYTVDDNYVADGWYVSENNGSTWTKKDLNYDVHSDISVKYVAVPGTFNFTGDDTTGVTETKESGFTADDKVTYKTDAVLTYEYSGDDKVITGVSATAGGKSVTVTTENTDGIWTVTIPGDSITGDIVMSVSLSNLWKVTFADNHTTGAAAEAYHVEGREGYYTTVDKAKAGGAGDFTVPTPEAEAGYRLADKSGENLWLTNETTPSGFTASTIATAAFTADTTVTAQVVKTWTVTYVAGENGEISGDADKLTLTVDEGTEISTLLNPTGVTTTPDAGYKFQDWTTSASGAVNTDVTVTANFVDDSYLVTVPTTVTGITVTPSGIGYNESDKTATHGSDLTITVVVADGHKATKASYTINGTETAFTEDELVPGTYTYTINGDKIIGAISVTVEANATFNVTFKSEDVSKGGVGTADTKTTTVTFDENYVLTEADVPTPVAKPGYEFVAWDTDPVGEAVTEAVTYTATFTDASYKLTENGDETEDGVTHGEDYTFTPSVPDEIVTDVTVTIGGEPYTPVKNPDGSYTIDGDDIVGEVVITYTTIEAEWEFITFENYKGSKSYHQIAILKTDFQDGSTFRLDDSAYGEAYYSEKYAGYVWFVYQVSDGTHAAETEASLSAKLKTVSGSTATKVTYENGDINGSGIVTAADAGIINDVLHQNASSGVIYTISDKTRFELDVMGDKSVTSQDVQWILDEVVGKTH